MATSLRALRVAGSRRGRIYDEHLAGSIGQGAIDALEAAPFGGQHEQRQAIRTTEHARERAAIERHGLEHLAALTDANDVRIADVREPQRAIRVQADASG